MRDNAKTSLKLNCRVIGTRSTPSASRGANSPRIALARVPPVVEFDDQADAVAAFDLALGHVNHVPEQSAERRTQDVDDFQAGGHDGGVPQVISRRAREVLATAE